MSGADGDAAVAVVKNADEELPVPSVWRPVFRRVIDAFVDRDYGLSRGVTGVAAVSEDTAEQIREYISDYGERLTHLPDSTWSSSVSIWMGEHWDVLVDLWTEGEGQSDLVLRARVRESGEGFEIEIHMVYVP